jgi:hypothetical protein
VDARCGCCSGVKGVHCFVVGVDGEVGTKRAGGRRKGSQRFTGREEVIHRRGRRQVAYHKHIRGFCSWSEQRRGL